MSGESPSPGRSRPRRSCRKKPPLLQSFDPPERKRRRTGAGPTVVDPTHYLGYCDDSTSIEEIMGRFQALETFQTQLGNDGVSEDGQLNAEAAVVFYEEFGKDKGVEKEVAYQRQRAIDDAEEFDDDGGEFERNVALELEDEELENRDFGVHELTKWIAQEDPLDDTPRGRFAFRTNRRRSKNASRSLRADPFFRKTVPEHGLMRPFRPRFGADCLMIREPSMFQIANMQLMGEFRWSRVTRMDLAQHPQFRRYSKSRVVHSEPGGNGIPPTVVRQPYPDVPTVSQATSRKGYFKNWHVMPRITPERLRRCFPPDDASTRVELCYCCPPYDDPSFSMSSFAELPFGNGEDSIFVGGYLCIWCPGHRFQEVYEIMRYKWGFYYCETICWIKLHPTGQLGPFAGSPVQNASECLYIFRKNTHQNRVEATDGASPATFVNRRMIPSVREDETVSGRVYKHQRFPDCFFDVVGGGRPHWFAFTLMEQLFPYAINPECKKYPKLSEDDRAKVPKERSRAVWLWADPRDFGKEKPLYVTDMMTTNLRCRWHLVIRTDVLKRHQQVDIRDEDGDWVIQDDDADSDDQMDID